MNSSIFINDGLKCEKCGRTMYLSTCNLPVPELNNQELKCWKCHCGNATFSQEQLDVLAKAKKIAVGNNN